MANGFDVLMAAEDDGLSAAAANLDGDGHVEVIQGDLRDPNEVERLWARVMVGGRQLNAAAINAGVGNAGRFVETSLEDDLALIALNVASTVHLAKRVLSDMAARREGRVLFTSSIVATMPGPYYATYVASKAFVQSFAEAVRHEVSGTGVTVTTLMPGPTDTEFFERAGMQGSKADEGPKDDPAEVARDGFEAMMAGEGHVVAGSVRNRVQAGMAKVLPWCVAAAVQGRQAKPGSIN